MSGRTTIVTGGTLGIGAAIAKAFLRAGDHVVIAARRDNGLAQTMGEPGRLSRRMSPGPRSPCAGADGGGMDGEAGCHDQQCRSFRLAASGQD